MAKLQRAMAPVCVVTAKGRGGAPSSAKSGLEINFLGLEDDGSESILLLYSDDVPVLAQEILDSLSVSRTGLRELFRAASAMAVIKAPESHIMANLENGKWRLWLSDGALH
jgi:hypothetical protein